MQASFYRNAGVLFLLLFALHSSAQAQGKLFPVAGRLSFDNDFLNLRGEGTDRGYTNGIRFSLLYKKQTPRFAERLLMRLSDTAENLYGYHLMQTMFTPDNISKLQIQDNDRPYAACLFASNSLNSADADKGRQLSTELAVGVLGKYAFGEQLQNFLHHLVRYKSAQGWANQVATDVILQYWLQYEQLLVRPGPSFDLIGSVQGSAGTLYTNMGLSLLTRAGLLNNHFLNDRASAAANGSQALQQFQQLHVFAFMQATGFVVMDDATLEGGFFTHDKSPYTIPKDNLKRLCLEYRYGFVVEKRPFRFVFSQSLRTAEFKGDYVQQTGNVSVQFGL